MTMVWGMGVEGYVALGLGYAIIDQGRAQEL